MAKKTTQRAPMDAPYAGLDGRNRPIDHKQPHLLVSGSTGTGKSRTCLGPNIIMWGKRPVVAVSSKADLAELTAAKRASRGPCYLMDLSGEVRDEEIGAQITRVASDPTGLVHSDDSALDLANLLLEVGSIGGGSGGSGGNDAFWKSLARRPLAATLRAAASYSDPDTEHDRPGGGIAWALEAADSLGESTDGEAEPDYDTPSWMTAARRCTVSGSKHGRALTAALEMDAAQRDSIRINIGVALGTWARDEVREPVAGQRPVPFHPSMLEAEGATLYVVSPLSGDAMPAATATLTSLVNHWRKRVGRIDTLLMVIDELPSTAYLPRLSNWVGEARGLGIRIVAAVQATSQFEERWGAVGLKVLRDLFPAALILPDTPEPELYDAALWMTPSTERVTASLDAAGNVSHARDKTSTIERADLVPPEGYGRLLVRHRAGHLARLVDIAATTLLD